MLTFPLTSILALFSPVASAILLELPSEVPAEVPVPVQWTCLPVDPLIWNLVFSTDGVRDGILATTIRSTGELSGTTNVTFPAEGSVWYICGWMLYVLTSVEFLSQFVLQAVPE